MKPIFDHEKLDVYDLELAFVAWVTDFFEDVAQSAAPNRREVLEQLDRASLSALLNTAEGNDKRMAVNERSSSMMPAARH